MATATPSPGTATFSQFTKSMVVSALVLVVGLAWNEAISTTFQRVFHKPQNQVLGLFIYAFILTIVVFLVIHWFFK